MTQAAVTVFEGITLNRASELLYDTEATVTQRTVDSLQYVRSLEDVVFGVVFGGGIATGKVSDVVPGVCPFRDLQDDLKLNVQEVDSAGVTEPQILEDSIEVEILREMIEGLDGAVRRDPLAWKSLARRELVSSLHDPALMMDLDDPSEYAFAGRANFWPHRKLQESVPEHYLSEMLKEVRNHLNLPAGVCENALRAFLSRNVLAHLLIFRRYQKGFRRRFSDVPALHVPYATRASLVPDWGNATWTVRHHLVPRVALRILDQSKCRGDFREWLGHYTWGNAYHEHRRLLAEALSHQLEGRIEDTERVIAALTRLCEGDATDAIRVGSIGSSDSWKPLPIAVRMEVMGDIYFAGLLRVFPELRFDLEVSQKRQAREPSGLLTGYPSIDKRLEQIRVQALGQMRDIQSTDIADFLLFLGAVGAIAGQALQGNVFPGKFSEKEFQAKMRDLLRSRAELGGAVQEHAHVASGILDLAFRGIPLELKVVADHPISIEEASRFFSQLRMYAIGNDHRFSILCVLDCSEKCAALHPILNDISFQVVNPPSGAFGVGIGIVIVRGNLSSPSSYSRETR